jgi:hypothetical protein
MRIAYFGGLGSPDLMQRGYIIEAIGKSAESPADSEFFINISERFRWRRRTSAATVRTNRHRNLTVAATIPVSLRAGDEHRRTQMFNRTHTAAIALAGAVFAAALTPAMAFTPPHITINAGPPAHVNVPTPGPSPRVFFTPKTTFGQTTKKNGAIGRSHFDGVPGDRKGNDPNWHSVEKAPTPPSGGQGNGGSTNNDPPPKDAGKPGGV